MISVSKDDFDKVIAYCEWRQVAQSGFDKLYGEYIWINDYWIHDDYSNNWDIHRELMNDILRKAKSAKWWYFTRRKYDGRMSKIYTIDKLMKLLERGMVTHGW